MATKRTVRQVQRVLMWALAIVLVLLASALLISTYRVFGTLSVVRAERIEAESTRAELAERVAVLKDKLAALKTERGVEEHIRSTYPWVKNGEVEFIFVKADSVAPEPEAPATVWERLRALIPFW
ncbi:hypothetical protein KGO06_01340 [Patescibacteria group bacterium]|nr:hypothetical protein [Patescibacteria group bacterium]